MDWDCPIWEKRIIMNKADMCFIRIVLWYKIGHFQVLGPDIGQTGARIGPAFFWQMQKEYQRCFLWIKK
jgi:hypothetical protein